MSNTATRLITLIMLLQRKPNQKASELAKELNVSVRTIHRYIAMLDEMGIPVYSERGPHGGFRLIRGYRMPPLIFTPEEAVAVCLGTSLVSEIWGRIYRDASQGALAKIDNVLPDEQRYEVAWARRSLLATGMHRADFMQLAPLLEELRRATRERQRVRMVYRGRRHPEPTQRDLDPYAMVLRWGWWYVIGYCHMRQAMRTFRVDRIIEMEVINQTFNVPDEFDIREYLAEENAAEPHVHVQMRFTPDAALVAKDGQTFWETMEEQPDGSVVVTFSSPSIEWAAWQALYYGSRVTVLAPPELRRLVAEQARAIVKQYASAG